MPTLKEIAQKIEATLPEISELAANAEMVVNEDMLGIITRRIFNEGKKANGTDIGKYSDTQLPFFMKSKSGKVFTMFTDPRTKKASEKVDALIKKGEKTISYKEWRQLNGLKTDKINLQFTDGLFLSVNIGSFEGKPAIGITNDEKAKIAGYLEERFGIIFAASQKEKEEAINTAREYMFDGLREIIKKWS